MIDATAEMTPRERWKAVLEGHGADRPPCDYWATAEVTARLRRELHCPDDRALWKRLGVDKCIHLAPRHPRAVETDWHLQSLFSIWGIVTREIGYGSGVYCEVAIGIDVLNPIQWRCRGMDRATPARDFGRRVVFHGGMDNQQTLPFSSPADVRREVEENIALFSTCKGYVVAPCHNIQANTPTENIVTLHETVREGGAQ